MVRVNGMDQETPCPEQEWTFGLGATAFHPVHSVHGIQGPDSPRSDEI